MSYLYSLLGWGIGLVIIVSFGFLLFAAAPPPAAAWGTSWTWETAQPTQYKLDASGSDMRVYEWRLQGANDIICVALFGSEGNYGMQCRKTGVEGSAPKLGEEE